MMRELIARAIREEAIRQLRENEKKNCPAGARFYEEEIGPYQQAQAALDAIREALPADAVNALRNGQQQADMDGVLVKVSRQAIDELLAFVAMIEASQD